MATIVLQLAAWNYTTRTGTGRLSRGLRLAEERVEVVVRADPDPDNRTAIALADRPVLLVDPHRPDLFIARELLES